MHNYKKQNAEQKALENFVQGILLISKNSQTDKRRNAWKCFYNNEKSYMHKSHFLYHDKLFSFTNLAFLRNLITHEFCFRVYSFCSKTVSDFEVGDVFYQEMKKS